MEYSKNIVFFLNDNDDDVSGTFEEDDIEAPRDKLFLKTQKIELSKKVNRGDLEPDTQSKSIINPNLTQKMPSKFLPSTVDSEVKPISEQRCGGPFSKTLSKTVLLNKIKAALGKQGNPEGSTQNHGKTPRKFIVKRS